MSAALVHCSADEDSGGARGSGGPGGAGADAGGSGGTAATGATGGSGGGSAGASGTAGAGGSGGNVDCTTPGPTWRATWVALEQEVIDRVNDLRQAGATCGTQTIAPVAAVAADETLTSNARNHSRHMSETGLGFDGPDGSNVNEWGLRCFEGTSVGVNIAQGHPSGTAFVNALMSDESTCKNVMMDATHVGVGYYSTMDPDADAGTDSDAGPDAAPAPPNGGWWTLVLAR